MLVIGLTGGIGTGKSTIAAFLAEMGAAVIDADKVGHELLKPGAAVYAELIKSFGPEILTPTGEIDRARLARLAFSTPENSQRLNDITHPAIYEIVRQRLDECRRQERDLAVIEATLLIEAGWSSLVNEIWVTTAPRPTVLKRLQNRSAMTAEEAMARISSQMLQEERTSHADVVIDTNCSLEELKARLEKLVAEFRKRHTLKGV